MASPKTPQGTIPKENLLGLLKVKIKRGLSLAVRDITDSDPYLVIKMGDQVGSWLTFCNTRKATILACGCYAIIALFLLIVLKFSHKSII